ncbi:MAG: hypothetical protein JWN78_950 [Bacteroidota bacterium]|nr:hypothetical protein [Bacteroidota bacterium]
MLVNSLYILRRENVFSLYGQLMKKLLEIKMLPTNRR